MKVEIWSDIVCPWCYIGKRRFEEALSRFEHAADVEVVWRSFELDPTAPARREGSHVHHLARKYGMSVDQAQAASDNLTRTAEKEDLFMDFSRTQGGNTFDGHRLIHLAAQHGRQDEMKEALMRAYFSEGRAIGETATLVDVAAELGFDPDEVREVLAGDTYADEVRAEERDGQRLGITGVPFFVVDRAYGVSGAQNPDVLLEVLETAWAAAHPLTMVGITAAEGTDADVVCEGDACVI